MHGYKSKKFNTISDNIGVLRALYYIRHGLLLRQSEKQAAACNVACEGCKCREKDPDPSGIQPPTYAVELLKAPASTRRGAPQHRNCSFVLTTTKSCSAQLKHTALVVEERPD